MAQDTVSLPKAIEWSRVRAVSARFRRAGIAATVSAIGFLASGLAHGLSIDDALARFYDGNPTLKAVQLSIGSTNEGVNQVTGAALPQINLGVSPQFSRTYGYNGANPDGAMTPGGDVHVNSGALGLTLSVTQAVDLSGSIGNQIESAYLGLQSGWTGYYAQEQGLLIEAVNVYMNVLSTRAAETLSNASVAVFERQRDEAQQRFDAGLGTRTEVAAFEAALQGEKARAQQTIGNRETAEANFRRVFGVEPQELTFPDRIPNMPRSLNEAIERAMVNDPALLQAEKALRSAELNILSAKAQNGPSMSITASARHNQDLLRDSADYTTSFAASTSINVPLYQGGAGVSRVRQASVDRDAAEAQLNAQRAQTRANVIGAWNNLQAQEAALNSFVSQIQAAELAVRSATAEEQAGVGTKLATIDAEKDLTSAQVSLSTTRSGQVVAGYALLQAMGDLTSEKLRLPVANGYFRPDEDLSGRQVDNLATALYLGEDRETTTPSFVRWMYNQVTNPALNQM